ncbi:Cilia- and flagella-associated protein 70 [Phytophthora pseudosyringae]|uniref:Cilia- and flagella-associated protein 70 n=1 Tax=Phytophthora pseudosyringae TaxID=221518 RepID=A0A8T1W2T2_9STRA|nr:Cilia- and flagella-associated protein 70 [Phytophthora pseudosyringae]
METSSADSASGAFTVSLHLLTWQPDSANVKAPERQVWAFVQLVLPPEQPLQRVWFSAEDANMMTRSLAISTQSSGQALPLDYNQSSRAVPLTTNAMRELVQAQLLLSLYSGASRTRATDFLLSKTLVPLRTTLLGEKNKRQEVALTSPGETFVVDLDVQCDVALADFMLGARVLELHAPRVLKLPAEWTASGCMSNEDALQFCASVEQNSACYELEIALPKLGETGIGADGGRGDEGTSSPYKFDVTTLKGGKLQFEPAVGGSGKVKAVQEAVQAPDTGDEQQEERSATPVSTLSGEWSIQFPPTTVISVLYFKSSVERLIEFLTVEKHVGGTLRRSPTENLNGKALDAISAEFRPHLNDLLAPGTMRILPKAPLRAIAPVSRAFLEQELAGAASNDDKRKAQNALADYEASVLQAASLTSAVTTTGTHVEIVAEILHAPLVLQPPQTLEPPSKSIKELIPSRDLDAESEERRDIYGDLRTEIRLVVISLLREYEDVFRNSGDKKQGMDDYAADAPALRDDKKQTLIYRLNTQGVYHSFKESLKKRIVPVIREAFARSEAVSEESEDDEQAQLDDKAVEEKKKEQFGRLYTLLMREVNAILHETFYADSNSLLEKTHATAEGRPTVKEIASVLEVLRLKTVENEVSGDSDKSEMLHLDRIAYAEQHAAHVQTHPKSQKLVDVGTASASQLLMNVWYDYARFCIAQAKHDKAGAALQQCLRLDPHALQALIALVAVQCELRDFARTESLVKNAVVEAKAAAQKGHGESAEHSALAHALLAFFFSQFEGKDPTGNLTLFELLKAQQMLQNSTDSGKRRDASCISTVWIFLAEYSHECKLWGITQRALQLADSHLKSRDVLSSELRVMKRAMEAELCLRDADAGEDAGSSRAIKLLQEALEIDASHPVAWLTLGKVYIRQDSQTKTAIECLQRAHEHRGTLNTEPLRLGLFLRLGLALLHSSQFEAAEETFLLACEEFRVASCWLGVGIACLRLERWEHAQMALAEANTLDSSNPDVWGYLALVALSAHACVSAHDEKDAQQFVSQALRHNLSNPALLRELSNAFVAIDRLESAEKLLRLSLACQDSSLTRKTLADVLAAQNCAEDALRQYTQSLDVTEGVEERCALLEKCAQLLTTLGRPEEANEYRTMAKQFQAGS